MKKDGSKLEKVCGKRIIDTEEDSGGGIGILFEGNIRLAIYNQFIIFGKNHPTARSLIGKAVVSVEDGKCEVKIILDGDIELKVDMRDEAYVGPEAMQLIAPGEPIVIWN